MFSSSTMNSEALVKDGQVMLEYIGSYWDRMRDLKPLHSVEPGMFGHFNNLSLVWFEWLCDWLMLFMSKALSSTHFKIFLHFYFCVANL